jgi:hypothetical protein
LGPGSATPSPEKLQQLIGSTSSFECQVDFDQPHKGFASFFGWQQNLLGFSGTGTLVADGTYVWISGMAYTTNRFETTREENTQLAYSRIANVESSTAWSDSNITSRIIEAMALPYGSLT